MAKDKEQWITTKDVCQLLGCTPMTVSNYRNGIGKALKTSLPHYTEARGMQRHAVFFKKAEVVRWAKKNLPRVQIQED